MLPVVRKRDSKKKKKTRKVILITDGCESAEIMGFTRVAGGGADRERSGLLLKVLQDRFGLVFGYHR